MVWPALGLKNPLLHDTQLDEALDPENWPGGQFTHVLLLKPIVPAGQGRHADMPDKGATKPSAHAKQDNASSVLLYCPMGHGTH